MVMKTNEKTRVRRWMSLRSLRFAVTLLAIAGLLTASTPVEAGGILQAIGGAVSAVANVATNVVRGVGAVAVGIVLGVNLALGNPLGFPGTEPTGGFGTPFSISPSPTGNALGTLSWFSEPLCNPNRTTLEGMNQIPDPKGLPPCRLEMMDPTRPPIITPKMDPSANGELSPEEATGIEDEAACPDPLKRCKTGATQNQAGSMPGGKIMPFNGQEMLDQTDLFIPGRDSTVDVEIIRRHLSGIKQQDPHFGPAWAVNYVHTFEAVDPGAPAVGNGAGEITMRSFGRTDRFAKVLPNIWEGRDGRFDRLVYDGGSHAILAMPGGTMLHFKVARRQDAGQPVRIFGQLSGFISAKGNMLRIRLDWGGPSTPESFAKPRRILSITDSFGRSILFNYEDPRDRNLVTRIIDFSGREVRYTYNCNNNKQLAKVRTPAIASTAGLNDFPQGKTTLYKYSAEDVVSEFGPEFTATALGLEQFIYSIASVVAPNQGSSGETRLEWTYYVEPGGDRNGRVKTHTVGNTAATLAAGGTYEYDYQLLKPTTAGANDVVSRTTVTDRRGTRTELEYTNGLLVSKAHGLGLAVPAQEAVLSVARRIERGELTPHPRNLSGITSSSA